MNAGALIWDSILFLEAGFVLAVAFYLGLARYHSLRTLAGLALGGLLAATGLALLLDIALLGMLALATAALSGLYFIVALYDLYRHRDEYIVVLPHKPEVKPQKPDGLRAAAQRAIELLERENAGEALRVLREATWRGA